MPSVRLRLPDGRTVLATEGALVGRGATATVQLEDPSVSEAHALLSLREGRLVLLPLRGAIGVSGVRATEIALEEGLRVDLSADSWLEVESVDAPDPASASTPATHQRGRLRRSLTVRARYDTVHLEREGLPTLSLPGLQARLVSELATCGAPVGWQALALALWPDGGEDRDHQRQRFDRILQALRRKLRAAGLGSSLIKASGNGLYELVLDEGDRVIDET